MFFLCRSNGLPDQAQVTVAKEGKEDEDQLESTGEAAAEDEEAEKEEEEEEEEREEDQVEEAESKDTQVVTPVEETATGIEDEEIVESVESEDKKNGCIESASSDECKMFVGQIPRDWTDIQVRQLFSEFGKINAVNVLRDKRSNLSKGK